MTVHLPTVALVGRPNVGKSTLFNRMVGRRAALVDDQPGVTRDRLFGELRNDGRILRLVDTGGFDVDPGDDMVAAIVKQTQLAIDEADLVVLVLDVVAGLHPADSEIAKHLRRAGKKTIVVANKADQPQHDEWNLDRVAGRVVPERDVEEDHSGERADHVGAEEHLELAQESGRCDSGRFHGFSPWRHLVRSLVGED